MASAALIVAVVCCTFAAAQTDVELNTPQSITATGKLGEIQSLMFNTLRRSEGSLIGAGIVTSTRTQRILWETSQVFGVGGLNRNIPLTLDSCLNMNAASELLVVFAFLKIQQEHSVPASINDEISDTHTGGRVLQNPFNQKRLRYVDLLTHTSTLNDFGFESFTVTTPNTVSSLKDFIETRYFSGQIGTIYTTETPGTPAAYRFAKINIALLAYIVEVILGPTVLRTSFGSIQSYLYQQVLRPLGMSSTFFLSTTGAAPGIVLEGTTTGTFFQGCIADQFGTSMRIHPAAVADYMVYTTPADLGRLTYHLFLDTAYQAILLKMSTMTRVASTVQPAISGQGLGVQYFDGTRLCTAATSTRVIPTCPIDNSTTITGYISQRDAVTVGIFCHPTETFGHLCTSMMLLYSTANARTATSAFAMAAATSQELVGTISVATPPPAAPLRNEDDERVFGVYIFIGAYLSVLLVIFGTSLLQYLFNPAALAVNTDTGAVPNLGPKSAAPSDEPSILPQTD